MKLDWLAGQGGPLHGAITVPGDKSVSHRAVMLAAIAEGSSRTVVHPVLCGIDYQAALVAGAPVIFGVRFDYPGKALRVRVSGAQHDVEIFACWQNRYPVSRAGAPIYRPWPSSACRRWA